MARKGPQKIPGASQTHFYGSGQYSGSAMEVNCGVIHTTEGRTLPTYSGGALAPTVTGLPDLKAKKIRWYQHYDVDESARALANKLGGVETNTANTFQIELVGTCDDSKKKSWSGKKAGTDYLYWPAAPDWALAEVAWLVRWLHEQHGVPLTAVKDWLAYGKDPRRPGVTPASYGASPARMTQAEWRAFTGWCFTGDTLVTTRQGQVPIGEIAPGDQVLTHKGRFRPVTALQERVAETGVLIGHGHPGLRTTPEHPFLSTASRHRRRPVADDANRARALVHGEPEWVDAQSLPGRYWATPAVFPPAAVPDVPALRGEGRRTVVAMTPELMQLAGRHVADGHLGSGGTIVISASHEEEADVTALCQKAGFEKTTVTHRDRAALQIAVQSVSFSAWLLEHFGRHAHAKYLPTWLLGAPEAYRSAFLDGYLDGDGHWESDERFDARTVSKRLAVGLRLLATSLGYAAALYVVPARTDTFPDGRVARAREQWRLKGSRTFGRGSATKVIGEHRFSRVKSWALHGDPVPVFNLSVAEDESYVVDGIVVHNCGHQHVPENAHGDPGAMDFARVIQLAKGESVTEKEEPVPDYVNLGLRKSYELRPGDWESVKFTDEWTDEPGHHSAGGSVWARGPARFTGSVSLHIGDLPEGAVVQARMSEFDGDTFVQDHPIAEIAGTPGDTFHVLPLTKRIAAGRTMRVRLLNQHTKPVTVHSAVLTLLTWKES
ncbi:Hint domain-containing protein [Streptomyces sp. NPDC088387]|uniref:Hint domain-containing protein n=1 Tax=Streptomyces sp. NPDC088387 TaxID=3365859 RepID=UPI003807BFBC